MRVVVGMLLLQRFELKRINSNRVVRAIRVRHAKRCSVGHRCGQALAGADE